MATETWTYDGVNLSNYASGVMINDIRTWNGLDDVPGVNVSGGGSGSSGGTNGFYQLAQTHGEFWYPQYFTATTKKLTIFVSSNNPSTGAAPTSVDQGRQFFDANLDALTLLFQRRRNLSSLVRQLSSGASRLALVTVCAPYSPELVPVTNGLVTVELTLPDGFWRDASDSTLVTTFAPGTGTVLSGATAPMNDLEFDITGPVTNPRVTDNESGSWVQYNGTVAATNVLKIFNTTMNISGTGFTPTLVNMQHSGDSNWLTLYPTVVNNGANITFGGTSTTGATNLAVIGHKKYMR
jgi:hypothetical protein